MLPKALLLSNLTGRTLKPSFLGPRSQVSNGRNEQDFAEYHFLLLFMVFKDILYLVLECVEPEFLEGGVTTGKRGKGKNVPPEPR